MIVATFAATLFLRLRGIDWSLPLFVEPDVHLAPQVEGFRAARSDWYQDLDFGKYPHLLARLLQPFAVFDAPEALGARALEAETPSHLRRAMGVVLEVRYLIAILGAALAPLTFALARLFLPTRWSLLACGLVAFSTLDQHYAQQARPHAAAATLALLAAIASVSARRRPTPRRFFAAGVATALAIGALHNGVALTLPLATALVLARPGSGPTVTRRLSWALLALAPIALAVRVFYPFLFEGGAGGATLFEWGAGGLQQSSHTVKWSRFDGTGLGTVVWTLWSYEPVLSVLTALWLALWALGRLRGDARRDPERRRDLVVLLAYVIPYTAALCAYAFTFQRFVLPLLPYLACASAAGLAQLERAPLFARASSGVRSVLGALAVLAILIPPGLATWRLGSLRAAPDTLELAAAWITAHADPKTRVFVSPGIDLPLARTPDAVLQDAELPHGNRPQPWIDYQAALLAAHGPELPLFAAGRPVYRFPVRGKREMTRLRRDASAWFRELGVELLVVPLVEKRDNTVAWFLREEAQRNGALVASFSPEADPELRVYPFLYTEAPVADPMHFTRRVFRVRAVGFTVEIYRMGP